MAVEIKYVVIREGEEKKCLLPAKKRPTLTTKCSIWQRWLNDWLVASAAGDG
ncbi:LexA family transcriptional regulator [Klebsiella pneumoniae]|uniref:LexA family transcriptional regulator n=1 Tax=Klebsiella pneumoniae TaxID=573 RepID=A0A3S5DI83_KLEPN|nr:LexA family transcriptional regulator [Klebsiella pneumoniae]